MSLLLATFDGNGYTLEVETGSFALTGVEASLEHGYEIVPAIGTFALTGQNASLEHGYRLSADSGAFAVTGQDAALEFGRRLQADAGAFQLSGTEASGLRSFVLNTSSGSLEVQGTAATLLHTPVSEPEPEPVPVFGGSGFAMPRPRPPRELVHYEMVTASGRFTLRGSPVRLRRGRAFTLAAKSASVQMAGDVFSARISRRLIARSSAFTFSATVARLAKHPDAVELAWRELQQEKDDEQTLLNLGVFDR